MKARPFISAAKAAVLVCFTFLVVLPLLVGFVWTVQDWRYARFCWRSQEYYAQFAEACDQLLAADRPMPRKLGGEELQSLSPLLRQLNISHGVVDTNLVMLRVGNGLMSHQILWKPEPTGSSWNLSTGSPETRKSRVLYTKAKPTPADAASEVDSGERLRRYIERPRPAATDSQL